MKNSFAFHFFNVLARGSFLVFTTILVTVSGFTPFLRSQDFEPPNGLRLWLDASLEASLDLDANEGSSIDNHPTVSQWKDRSKYENHFQQKIGSAKPRWVTRNGAKWIRFDGIDDQLRRIGPSESIEAATIFIMASPRDNPGDFRGLFSWNAREQRDYESGLNIDLGPGPSRKFDHLNVEGRGFGGAQNLKKDSHPFGRLHLIEVRADPKLQQVSMWLDGVFSGQRPWQVGKISIDEWTLGARYYTNGPGDQIARGPVHADFAEVLVFDRALNDDESDRVRAYLTERHQALAETLSQEWMAVASGYELTKVENPPDIQMLIPGFEVDELPISMSNINSIRYRPDGKLVTLGYNGDVHLLSDVDGDGYEDDAQLFWKNDGSLRGPIGMVLTRPEDKHGWGVIVPSKGKVSLIVDRDGDDRADEEVVIASGWKEIPQAVDAVGMAMGPDGSLYFGLGTADYSNAYQVDDQGKSSYDIHSDRGTVQRLSPDFQQRETVCTGIRFPIAFAFNDRGDLFCTEQEGATWLPNGNPFDELLHIQAGRHYGFPPRHPKYNPDVIDEPSLFDFGPQHQSTCGMVFNRSDFGGGAFGPESWHGDAIICGESRGKIWRTKLAHSKHGYVASSQLIACLQMLTVDACLSPRGDLIVACHSGPPDWGTGPTGPGKLFRIRTASDALPRPLMAWPDSPNEVRIAFDRPIDPLSFRRVSERVRMEYGRFVKAGDRYENLVPPYAVVQRQSLAPRQTIPVAGLSLSKDRRTMLVQVGSMKRRGSYALSIPSNASEPVRASTESHHIRSIGQLPEWDVDFEANGVQVDWQPTAGTGEPNSSEGWQGWLPHLDLDVARELTKGSHEHEVWFKRLEGGGRLELTTQMDVHDFLRPKIQPGASIDYPWPDEQVMIVFQSSQKFAAKVDEGELDVLPKSQGGFEAKFQCESNRKNLVRLAIHMECVSGRSPDLTVACSTNEDSRLRPLPLHRFFPRWVDPSLDDVMETSQPIAEIAGGDWGRGRRVFHSDAAACFKCHAIHGSGANIGPDLSNLIHRDYASVRRDIIHPSYAINPDHIGQIVVTDSGQVLTGVLRTENHQLLIGDEKGNVTRLDPREIESMKPSEASIMPKGLDEKLTTEQFRDLMTFLLTSPPHMPKDSPLKAPPLRTAAEVAAALEGSIDLPSDLKPLKVVLVAGAKDHGPGEHDYPAWQVAWGQLMSGAPHVQVEAAWEFPEPSQLENADIVIFFQKGSWNDDRQKAMDRYFSRGGGAVYIHWAVNGDERVTDFSNRIGLASRGGNIRYRHGPLTLNLHTTDHPIMRNLETLELYDESYWLLTGSTNNVTLFASSLEDGQATPQVWAYEKGGGRVFVSIPGHYSWTFDDPLFRILLLRGIAWTANEPVDRFNELVPLGARIAK